MATIDVDLEDDAVATAAAHGFIAGNANVEGAAASAIASDAHFADDYAVYAKYKVILR